MKDSDDTASASGTCWICREGISSVDDTVEAGPLVDGTMATSHRRCLEGIVQLLRAYGNPALQHIQLGDIVRRVEDEWILLRRGFPDQYSPVLVYFALYEGELKTTQDFSAWMRKNKLEFSNPSVPLNRLVKRGLLAVSVGKDKVTRYFITSAGILRLEEYIEALKQNV